MTPLMTPLMTQLMTTLMTQPLTPLPLVKVVEKPSMRSLWTSMRSLGTFRDGIRGIMSAACPLVSSRYVYRAVPIRLGLACFIAMFLVAHPAWAQRRDFGVPNVLIQEIEAIGVFPGGELGAQAANTRPQLVKKMRGLIQNELSIIGDICELNPEQQQSLVDLAESEWKAKTSATITKRTQENTYGLVDLDGLAERVVRSWLQSIATTDQLAKYDDELADRMRWRQKAVISKMLDTYETKLNLSGVQMEQIEERLNEKWKDRFYKSLEATFDSSLLPEIKPLWISEFLSEAQRAALVTRDQVLQRSFLPQGWQDFPTLDTQERFKVGKVQSNEPKEIEPQASKSKTLEKIDAIIEKAKAEDEGTFDDKKP